MGWYAISNVTTEIKALTGFINNQKKIKATSISRK
jgi:hypothetical protein